MPVSGLQFPGAHKVCAIGGVIPVIGAGFDIIDASLYGLEGDKMMQTAAISGAALNLFGSKWLFSGASSSLDNFAEAGVKYTDDAVEAGRRMGPSDIARSWQGAGDYPGIDDYKDVVVNRGTVLYRGEPYGTEYFTTLEAIENSNRDATKVFQGLQVKKNPEHGYRGEMQGYLFNQDIASAYGITLANPQFGKGGLPQYFVPNANDLIDKGVLIPVDNIILYK